MNSHRSNNLICSGIGGPHGIQGGGACPACPVGRDYHTGVEFNIAKFNWRITMGHRSQADYGQQITVNCER